MMLRPLLRSTLDLAPFHVRNRLRFAPGVAGLRQWLVADLDEEFTRTVARGPASGLCTPVSLPTDRSIWNGAFEHEFADAIRRHIRAGDVCYDIGGYRGFMAGVMALAGAKHVIVFEPIAANSRRIAAVQKLNSHLPIILKPFAIGKHNGSVEMDQLVDSSMARLVNSPFQSDRPVAQRITVEMRTLDSVVSDGAVPEPNLIKIDVEGAEIDVLEGATEVLTRSRPALFIETHSPALTEACAQRLASLGYSQGERIGRKSSTTAHYAFRAR
jgi:FkbM family methyltransferase